MIFFVYKSIKVSLFIIILEMVFFSNFCFAENNQSFSVQRIETIIEKWIEKNPEILRNVLDKFAEKQNEENLKNNLNFLSQNSLISYLGNNDGDIEIFEFFDYNCGYCKSVFNTLLELIEEDKNIKLFLIELPVFSGSEEISRLALASKYQNSYNKLHKRLMTFNGRLNKTSLLKIAESIDININQLINDSSRQEIINTLNTNKRIANNFGLSGTPSFIIGKNIIPGAIKKNQFIQIIQNIREKYKL